MTIIGKIKSTLATIGAALTVIVGVFVYGRWQGKAAANDERAEADAKAIKKAGEIEHDIKNIGDDDVERRLSRWMRDER